MHQRPHQLPMDLIGPAQGLHKHEVPSDSRSRLCGRDMHAQLLHQSMHGVVAQRSYTHQ